jgi:hypothetical protein
MPERTVDAWVASAICTAFPAARIWDPTQAMKGRNWDRAAALLGEGRVFLFEDKGTTPVTRKRKAPLQTHRIDIDRAQLDWYCDEVEPTEDVPVYYVLPKPPWKGSASSGHVPEQVVSRVTASTAACWDAAGEAGATVMAFLLACVGTRRARGWPGAPRRAGKQ